MKSPHGRRGAILAHFGWTMDYLLNGISWALVQKIMLDAPSVDYDSPDDEEEFELTQENSEQIMNYVNSMM